MYTCKRSLLDMSEFLLKSGIDANAQTVKRGTTALMIAAVGGNLDLIRLLLDNGADPELKDKFGQTAAVLADRKGNKEAVGMLRKPPETLQDP